jgi:hypothetical protein
MAFPDPVSTTVGTTTYTLNRIATGGTKGIFRDDTQKVRLEIVPSTNRSGRRISAARLTMTKTTTDPLVSTTNVEVSGTVTVAFNMPAYGFTTSDVQSLFKALNDTLSASSSALQIKLINQES